MKYNAYRFALLVERMLRAQRHYLRASKKNTKLMEAKSLEEQADKAAFDLPAKDKLRAQFLKCREHQREYFRCKTAEGLRVCKDAEKRLAETLSRVIEESEKPRSLFAELEKGGAQ